MDLSEMLNGRSEPVEPPELPSHEAQVMELRHIQGQFDEEQRRRNSLEEGEPVFRQWDRVEFLHRSGPFPTFAHGSSLVCVFWRKLTPSPIDVAWLDRHTGTAMSFVPTPDCLVAYLSKPNGLMFEVGDTALLRLVK